MCLNSRYSIVSGSAVVARNSEVKLTANYTDENSEYIAAYPRAINDEVSSELRSERYRIHGREKQRVPTDVVCLPREFNRESSFSLTLS